jgi:hypothetical protein
MRLSSDSESTPSTGRLREVLIALLVYVHVSGLPAGMLTGLELEVRNGVTAGKPSPQIPTDRTQIKPVMVQSAVDTDYVHT